MPSIRWPTGRTRISVLALALLAWPMLAAFSTHSALASADGTSARRVTGHSGCSRQTRHRPAKRAHGQRGCGSRGHRYPNASADSDSSRTEHPATVDAGKTAVREPAPKSPTPAQPITTPQKEEPKAEEKSQPIGNGTDDEAPAIHLFSPTSIWNTPLAANSPLDPSSALLAGGLSGEVARELGAKSGPGISTTSYSVPLYTVPADQPTTRVQLLTRFSVPALDSAWSAVPLPNDATPASGSDGHLVVWQPSSDRLWEFWRLKQVDGAWQASWGGAIQNVSSSAGAYGPGTWPGAGSTWGASASGLSIAGGLITLDDLQRGSIDHALALGIPGVRSGLYASPATRTDGRALDPASLPEGAHLRIDPNLELSTLRLPPLTRMMAEAAQQYGIVVRDTAGTVTFYAQDPTPTGANPFFGAGGYFEGRYAAHILASFPWSHLQLLRMDLHGNS